MKSFRNIGVLLLLSMSIFLAVIDLFVVNVAVPSIKESLNGTNSGAMFIIVAYVMGYASFLITGSIAGNAWGKKKVYVWGMLLFTVFSLFCSIAQTTFLLNIFRFFQGVSAAFMVPQGVGMIPYVFPDFKDRTKAFGIYGSIAGAAAVFGQFLGGFLPELNIWGIEGWRLIFIINIPLGGTAFVLSILKLKEVPIIRQKSFDAFGLLLLTVFLITLIYPLIVGGESHWPVWSIAMLVFSFLLLFIFYLYEKYRLAKLNPVLIDVNLFSLKEFNIGILAAVFYYIAQDSYFFLMLFTFKAI
ncbi:MFS transporter [Elizabethkingia anophelis]|uniref:MFS transporter n=1 Tax=Elizabethkingia TaxID=308865 RepID=UPI000AD614CD|nr:MULTISPECIES: MFS transporter [Elizabethkingia]MDX8560553.1 MFS transporter [Elizabethkingia sp. HX ZCH]MDX8579162.1 MFS transporter [Elizabethkingia sp. HX YK]